MSEEEKKAENERPTISKLAIVSISFCIIALLIQPIEFFMHRPHHIVVLGWQVCLFPSIAGFVIGLVALLCRGKSSDLLRVKLPAILGIFLASLVLLHWFIRETSWRKNGPFRFTCASNLRGLGKAVMIYAHDYGQYPEPNQWCDLLMKYGEVRPRQFVCPSVIVSCCGKEIFVLPRPQIGTCYYAMNPYCQPSSPPDTVLLFETNKGWNQFGGLELLSTDNHKGYGCNICFNDSHTTFEKGMFPELKWKPDEVQRE